MSECGEIQSQHVLLQARELRKSEREATVVAEVTEVAQVIADSLALEGERRQPRRARRHSPIGDCFDRLRIRPCIRDRAVARYASGEPMRFVDAHRFKPLLDSFVRIAEPLFEPQHFFSDDLKTEMAR